MNVEIIEGVVRVDSVQDFIKRVDCTVTFLNADYVASREHAEFAARKAIKAWTEGRRVARTLAIEVMLYAAATRQISKAMTMGLKEGDNRVVAVVIDGCADRVRRYVEKERVLGEMDEEKINRICDFFEISDEEVNIVGVERIPLLVRERIVLFDISK